MVFDPMKMHGIIRYANRNRIKDEDLAQHSYSVAAYCFEIAKDFGISDEIRNEAIAMAIIHDVGECFTSDLPHDVKTENPELKQLCDKLEEKYIDKIPSINNLWHKLEDNKDSIPSVMVKLGDTMSVKAYVKRELSLGNRSKEMTEINEDVDNRLGNLSLKLSKLLKNK